MISERAELLPFYKNYKGLIDSYFDQVEALDLAQGSIFRTREDIFRLFDESGIEHRVGRVDVSRTSLLMEELAFIRDALKFFEEIKE